MKDKLFLKVEVYPNSIKIKHLILIKHFTNSSIVYLY
jgi:hypothetical protein